MPGNRLRSIKGGKKGAARYEALRASGLTKSSAAAIANTMAKGKKARSKMAKRAAKTRAKRGS